MLTDFGRCQADALQELAPPLGCIDETTSVEPTTGNHPPYPLKIRFTGLIHCYRSSDFSTDTDRLIYSSLTHLVSIAYGRAGNNRDQLGRNMI